MCMTKIIRSQWPWLINCLMTYDVEDSEYKKQVVKYSVNPLSWKCPNGTQISQQSQISDDKYQNAFREPFKPRYSGIIRIWRFAHFFDDLISTKSAFFII